MREYEIKINNNNKRNKKFLDQFEKWLKEKKYTKKTINKHINNVDFYINQYLNYYDITKMEDGVLEVPLYLGGYFIEKCMWASKNSLKENAASIKKFYKCMLESKYISNEDYETLCETIKEEYDEWVEELDNFDDDLFDEFDFF